MPTKPTLKQLLKQLQIGYPELNIDCTLNIDHILKNVRISGTEINKAFIFNYDRGFVEGRSTVAKAVVQCIIDNDLDFNLGTLRSPELTIWN